jgi:group II intron reverse transcriptase/maturase
MNGRRKSDRSVVPAKLSNKDADKPTASAERVEERDLAKENPRRQNTHRTQGRARVHSALERVRQAARKEKGKQLTSLMHHVHAVDTLREAYFRLNRQAAPGVDGVTWHEYGERLEENLQDLSARLRQGGYRARPVRRRYIPKADGRQRPLGVPALEDKLVQAATTMVLNAVYEVDFLGFSYGFRPGRGQHDALDALCVCIERSNVNWVLDADIRGFFDAINHDWLVKFVEHRVGDRRVVRLIQKWLKAGVLEDGERIHSEEGTPQGGSISPLLANIYLHYVFDLWAHHVRRRHCRGDVRIVRYADDFVVGFEHRVEAERFVEALKERFAKFGLELHPDKTRLIEFGRYAAERRRRRGQGRPETFNFLGFTHLCGKSKAGMFRVERHTMRQRLCAKLNEIARELKRRRHYPIPVVGAWLKSILIGHYRYYGVPLNYRAITRFRWRLTQLWHRQLCRRSQHGSIRWSRMETIVGRWMPAAQIYHPFPGQRLRVSTQGRSPVR